MFSINVFTKLLHFVTWVILVERLEAEAAPVCTDIRWG